MSTYNLFNLDKHLALVDCIADLDVDRLNDTGDAAGQAVLHLHGLDDAALLALANLIADLDADILDDARHGRENCTAGVNWNLKNIAFEFLKHLFLKAKLLKDTLI